MRSSGRNANLKEKIIISNAKLNPDNWGVIKHTNDELIIKNKNTKAKIKLRLN